MRNAAKLEGFSIDFIKNFGFYIEYRKKYNEKAVMVQESLLPQAKNNPNFTSKITIEEVNESLD